jgi:hypothetical protein
MTKEYMKREDRTISENTVVVTSILLDEGEKARKSIKEHVAKKRRMRDDRLICVELPEHPRQLVIHTHHVAHIPCFL